VTGYRAFILPLLSRLDAESAHDQTLRMLRWAQRSPIGRLILRGLAGRIPYRPVELFGLRFPNEVGVAAGFDKDVAVASALAQLGFGHVEVGTITPRAQPGNPRPRLFRLTRDEGIINRMGFPNCGAEEAARRMENLDDHGRSFVLGVSVGKQKQTAIADAASDYIEVMQAVYCYADYVSVNVSSPNTPGLRELQRGEYLRDLLTVLAAENRSLSESLHLRPRPLLLKIAPDLTWPELDEILDNAVAHGVAGIIATNTTTDREGVLDELRGEQGGLSGRPLRSRSDQIIAHVHRYFGGQLPVIGVGGVFTADDARRKLDAGAALVQVYTGLVFEGPGMGGRLLRRL
jgi:dihydroorotate dehydrogenase